VEIDHRIQVLPALLLPGPGRERPEQTHTGGGEHHP
jgi:hypothetical protein